MALIKCGECGQQMSDRALKCPHCGAPAVVASRALAVGLAAGVFAALLGLTLWFMRASDAGAGPEAVGGPAAGIVALLVGVLVVVLALLVLVVRLRGSR